MVDDILAKHFLGFMFIFVHFQIDHLENRLLDLQLISERSAARGKMSIGIYFSVSLAISLSHVLILCFCYIKMMSGCVNCNKMLRLSRD